ncbi:DUF7935 family protein [Geofilum sp. OHC36d9]|uniref:DUF7935 family protein n=1 Tax=Geofilum sp. OHC36d9 TaxID=3458413 RepID=UPI0040342E07
MTDYTMFVLALLAIMVFTLLLVSFFLRQETRRRQLEIRYKDGVELMKHRLQAYERLTLLLERLSPEALILREQRHDLSGVSFHQHLLRVIRNEFDHNMAMQVYVNASTWEKIKSAREALVRLINSTAAGLDPKAPALELGRLIIENSGGELIQIFRSAIAAIRDEMSNYYQ